jgi:hypothetical protein
MKKLLLMLPGLWMHIIGSSGQVNLIPAEGYKALPVLETFTGPGPFDLFENFLYTGNGDTIYAVDLNTGTVIGNFGKPAGYNSYASFITVSPGGEEIWAGYTVAGNHDDRIYRIDVASGQWSLEARLPGNFELVFWNGHLLVSGLNSTGFNDPNGIYVLDTTGLDMHMRILKTGGYSAGLAVDERGHLYYGTSLSGEPNALYRWDSLQVASVTENPVSDTLDLTNARKLTDLPAGAYDCTVDEGGNVLFNFNDFMGDKVLALWNGTEGDGFRYDTLAFASGAGVWLGMVKACGDISKPAVGNRVLTVNFAPGQPLTEVHRDYIPVQLFPVLPISGPESSADSTVDLSLYFTDPDDEDAFSFEVIALSDPAITQTNVDGQELTVGFLSPGQAKIVVKAMNAGTSIHSEVLVGVQPMITGEYLISGFGDLELEPESYWNGSDGAGSFVSGAAQFYNTYNADWFVWNGWACSNMSDVTTPGFMNQYSAITGEGYDPGRSGNSSYAVSYTSPPSVIDFTGGKAYAVAGFMITNSTYAALSMEQGDAFSKKFGGADGTDPDFLRLLVWGRKDAFSTDTVEYLLADYTSDSSLYDHIIQTWQWVDLTSLGKVDSLVFTLESSDNSAWGMNTPAFFCMDELHVIPDMAPVVAHPGAAVTMDIFPNPSHGRFMIETGLNGPIRIEVYNLTGNLVYSEDDYMTGGMIDLGNRPAGSYLVRIRGTDGTLTGKINVTGQQ